MDQSVDAQRLEAVRKWPLDSGRSRRHVESSVVLTDTIPKVSPKRALVLQHHPQLRGWSFQRWQLHRTLHAAHTLRLQGEQQRLAIRARPIQRTHAVLLNINESRSQVNQKNLHTYKKSHVDTLNITGHPQSLQKTQQCENDYDACEHKNRLHPPPEKKSEE